MASPLLAWPETREATSKTSSGPGNAVELVAVHAVLVDKAGVRGDSTLCGVEVVGESEETPFHATLTATRCVSCAESLGRRHVVG
jgi:hypothetical protein